jgi:hypothetical protein
MDKNDNHLDNHLDNQPIKSTSKRIRKVAIWECNCGKKYKYQSGLCKHKKICTFINNPTIETTNNNSNDLADKEIKSDEYKEMFLKLFNENQEFKKIIIDQQNKLSEIIPKIGNNVNNITNNQKFNINIFLNENCKNAINMSDFIDSIKISVEELDTISTTGLASGLSTAIINNMQRLKIEDRPIHCTDVKRETLYIKDNDEWARDISHQTITKAIKQLSVKPFFALQEWKCDNPEFMDDEHKQDYFAKALQEIGKSNIKVDDKIVKAICNHTYLKNK